MDDETYDVDTSYLLHAVLIDCDYNKEHGGGFTTL